MARPKADMKKHISVALVALLIFSLGVTLGIIIDYERYSWLKSEKMQQDVNFQSLQLQYLYLTTIEFQGNGTCSVLLASLEDSIADLGYTLDLVTRWLAQNTKPQEVVLSSDENGFWIEYYARRPVVLDSRTAGVPQAFQVYNDTRAVFASRNLKEATDLLRKYKVRYILIDSQMRPLLMNEKRQEGLSFLLRNSERFKKEKEYSNIEIWQFFG